MRGDEPESVCVCQPPLLLSSLLHKGRQGQLGWPGHCHVFPKQRAKKDKGLEWGQITISCLPQGKAGRNQVISLFCSVGGNNVGACHRYSSSILLSAPGRHGNKDHACLHESGKSGGGVFMVRFLSLHLQKAGGNKSHACRHVWGSSWECLHPPVGSSPSQQAGRQAGGISVGG